MSRHLVEKRINSPQGTWDYSGIIGAKVQIKSIPITNLDDFKISCNDKYTVSNVYFQVSFDGKVVTVVELKEFPTRVFTWKDLIVVDIKDKPRSGLIVGTFNDGNCKIV